MDRESRRFIAETSHSGRTILDALRKFMPGSSWSDVRKLLAARRVLVSGALCLDEARRLATGEVIEVSALTQARPPAAADVRLVWLDANLVEHHQFGHRHDVVRQVLVVELGDLPGDSLRHGQLASSVIAVRVHPSPPSTRLNPSVDHGR